MARRLSISQRQGGHSFLHTDAADGNGAPVPGLEEREAGIVGKHFLGFRASEFLQLFEDEVSDARIGDIPRFLDGKLRKGLADAMLVFEA